MSETVKPHCRRAGRARRHVVGVALVGVFSIVAVLIAALAVPASAQLDTELSDTHTPFGGVNGPIYAAAIVGDELWVGGTFTTAYEADGSGAASRLNLARFDYNDGSLLGPIADVNGRVSAIASNGVDTVYIGGAFSAIDGEPAANIAAVSAYTGNVRGGFDAEAGGAVHDLVWNDGALYVAGEFTSWNRATGANLIQVDPATGDRDSAFDPNPHDKAWDIAIQGDRMYAAGFFENIGSFVSPTPRRWAAGFDLIAGAPAGPDLSLPALAPGEGLHKAEARAIGASPDGSTIYIGDDRNVIRAIDVATGVEQWSFESEGDIQAIAASDDTVFVGNHQGWFSKFDGRDLVALDQTTGQLSPTWQPILDTTDPMGLLDIVATDDALIGVGEFDVVNATPVFNLAVFRTASWTPAEALEPPFARGDVNCDGEVNLRDALFIAQHDAGDRADTTCPFGDTASGIYLDTADSNGDAITDLVDAMLVIGCRAGLANALCP